MSLESARQTILIFDSDCALCSRSANFVAARDMAGRFWYADHASSEGRALLRRHGLDPENLDAVVFIDGSSVHTGSTAALKAAAMLGLPWSLLGALLAVPGFLRGPVYKLIARNRHRLGSSAECPQPHPRLRAHLLE
jgi:predicted DCC family thiol-disulfide oxidoreductase YuxK